MDWDENSLPVSSEFDDVYFSKASGLEETRYVFLQHNQLPERWQSFPFSPDNAFTIAETGFGTGLNFLCAWQAFLQHAPSDARLHFISVEKYPLRQDDLARSLSLWPELAPLAELLIQAYPLPVPGIHRRHFDHGRVQLTLLQGDATELFSALEARVDAWFLDGFAPAKNPEMWTPELFQAIRRLSDHHTSVATFTAAGIVRHGLKAAGFEIRKTKGFGRKRHMVCGELILENDLPVQSAPAPDAPEITPLPLATPWQQTPWFCPLAQLSNASGPANGKKAQQPHCAVIGAGIAGSTTAHRLASQGYRVTLIEQHQPGQGGSGNRQGVLYIKLGTEPSAHSRFYLAGFEFSRHYLNQYASADTSTTEDGLWKNCGVLQLATSEKEQKRQQSFLQRNEFPEQLLQGVSPDQASDIAGTRLEHSGLYFPGAGWARPAELCHHFSQHPNIELKTGTFVDQLRQTDQSWQLLDSAGNIITEADQVVIACAASASHFAQTAWLPTKSIRGQTTYLQTNTQTPILKSVICHEGYIAPATDQTLCLGASFNLRDDDTGLRESDQRHNLQLLQQAMPDFYQDLQDSHTDITTLDGKTGFRCASPDYVPLAGPVPVYEHYLEHYDRLRHDATRIPQAEPAYYPGLWLNTGHGSRGLASAPLCAEVLSAYIGNNPQPLERDLLNALQPSRFIIRGLMRGRL
nr:bifunctional tRNA (5-methylaminomethyl-2-thiouridine)(34)-methyltransferase MnmD/FAD-dependent 5-carboxymethylaminomethyl-2-thiouridine(34) oxidoreductase MnmC [Oceanospirillum sediminis]